jgi:hypothetical protein
MLQCKFREPLKTFAQILRLESHEDFECTGSQPDHLPPPRFASLEVPVPSVVRVTNKAAPGH